MSVVDTKMPLVTMDDIEHTMDIVLFDLSILKTNYIFLLLLFLNRI